MRRLGHDRLRAFAWRRGIRVTHRKAAQIVELARTTLTLPPALYAPHAALLQADVLLLERLDREIDRTEAELADVLPKTPAAVLVTMPRVAVVRASNYGAAVGDPSRFASAKQVYRMSGLVPTLYESAGRQRVHARISHEGKVELREAIIELGRALREGHPNFSSYADRLIQNGKPQGVVAYALANRANRVAFVMVRDQRPFDSSRW